MKKPGLTEGLAFSRRQEGLFRAGDTRAALDPHPATVRAERLVGKSCLCNPRTVACQAPLFVGFSRQEYWSGLPFPSPGDLPNPGIKPMSPALQADSLPAEPSGNPEKAVRLDNTARSQSLTFHSARPFAHNSELIQGPEKEA